MCITLVKNISQMFIFVSTYVAKTLLSSDLFCCIVTFFDSCVTVALDPCTPVAATLARPNSSDVIQMACYIGLKLRNSIV